MLRLLCVVSLCLVLCATVVFGIDLSSWEKAALAQGVVGPNGIVPFLNLKYELNIQYSAPAASFVAQCEGATTPTKFSASSMAIDGRLPTVTTMYPVSSRPSISWGPLANDTAMFTLLVHDMDGFFNHMFVIDSFGTGLIDELGRVAQSYSPPMAWTKAAHRYVFLLFEQPKGWLDVSDEDWTSWSSGVRDGRTHINNVSAIADKYFGAPVGINWFNASVDAWTPGAWTHILTSNYITPAAKANILSLKPVSTACQQLGFK